MARAVEIAWHARPPGATTTRMRRDLPRFLVKWLAGSVVAWLTVRGFDAVAAPANGELDVFVLLTAGCGIVFAYAISVMVVLVSAYLYLGQHER